MRNADRKPVRGRIFRISLLFVVVCGLLVLFGFAASNYLDSSTFGKAEITLANGSRVYVVREMWGFHDDQLFLTQNPDGCTPANPSFDYLYRGGVQKVVYSTSDNRLVVYVQQSFTPDIQELSKPSAEWSNVRIEALPTRSMEEVLADPMRHGVKVMDAPESHVCWKNFFRKSRSFGAPIH